MTFKIGDRVKTLIHLTSADWHPEQPDIPAGSYGTVESIYYPCTARDRAWGYGVMLDDSVDPLAAWMAPTDIEAA